MSLQDWAVSAAAKGMIRDAEKDGRVQEAVVIAESTIKSFFPNDVKVIRKMIVQYVIFPFCKLWMKDDPSGFQEAKTGL